MRAGFWTVQVVCLGCGLLGLGIVVQARASGHGGLCQGQIVEEQQSDDSWRATSHICSGFCPPPGTGNRVECEKAVSGPFKQRGSHCVLPYTCACVTYGPDPRQPGAEMVILTQFDRVDPQDPGSPIVCDVEGEYEDPADPPLHIGCDGHCPGPVCRTNPETTLIVPGVSVRAPGCICP